VRVTRTTKPPLLAGLLRLDLIRARGGGEGPRAEGAAAEKEQRRSGVRRKKERGEEGAPTGGPWLSEREREQACGLALRKLGLGCVLGRGREGGPRGNEKKGGCRADLSFFSLLFCSFSN
jgi:hypothetical protein